MFQESMELFRSMGNTLKDMFHSSYQKSVRVLSQIHSYTLEMRPFHFTLSSSWPVSVQEDPVVDLTDYAHAEELGAVTTITQCRLHPRNLLGQPIWKILREQLLQLFWQVNRSQGKLLLHTVTVHARLS
jgi:hypothetical protein